MTTTIWVFPLFESLEINPMKGRRKIAAAMNNSFFMSRWFLAVNIIVVSSSGKLALFLAGNLVPGLRLE